jgi:hypothetical protein
MDDNDAVLANNYNGISEAHEAIDKTALEINIWSKTEQDAGRRWHRARYLCPTVGAAAAAAAAAASTTAIP